MQTEAEFTWEMVFQFAIGALRGLSCLHNWKPQILHRNLTSSNILIADDGSAKITYLLNAEMFSVRILAISY